jgi:hypothetical protein
MESRLVHQLVLETFVGPCPENQETRHLDGIPANNRLENLCWGTSQENNGLDKRRHGTLALGERHGSHTHPEKVARGERNGSHTQAERRPWGERNGRHTHPESTSRGDRHYSRLHPEKLARGDRNGSRIHPESRPRGTRVNTAELTDAEVLEIRWLWDTGLYNRQRRRLADMFGVSYSIVCDVISGKTWKHLLPKESQS